jgi:hypothetical protein
VNHKFLQTSELLYHPILCLLQIVAKIFALFERESVIAAFSHFELFVGNNQDY